MQPRQAFQHGCHVSRVISLPLMEADTGIPGRNCSPIFERGPVVLSLRGVPPSELPQNGSHWSSLVSHKLLGDTGQGPWSATRRPHKASLRNRCCCC